MSKGGQGSHTRGKKRKISLEVQDQQRAGRRRTQAGAPGDPDLQRGRPPPRAPPAQRCARYRPAPARRPQPAPGAGPWPPPPGRCREHAAPPPVTWGPLRRAALLLPDLALPVPGTRRSRSRPSPGKRRGGCGGGGGPALRLHDDRGGAGRHRPRGARTGDDAAGRGAAAARVAGRQSAPRRRRRAEREEERQASSAARRAGGGPAAPARPWPGSPENASCAPRLPPPLPAPRARRPTELLASPPPPSCGRPAAGCARTRRRRLPRAGEKEGAGARGPRRLAPAGAQRGM
ncbi:unnamed protein product [Rangifer tarandus platyrhynchus]|uniref:Uncharacterized protein n=1 Tax=Rangifer tarandus platyrhynchus TaxID=3082113 RepID=A0ABN8ZFG6_RANTA|nr:unnamed protein product [Rangifer tarandus platyrhynchus]